MNTLEKALLEVSAINNVDKTELIKEIKIALIMKDYKEGIIKEVLKARGLEVKKVRSFHPDFHAYLVDLGREATPAEVQAFIDGHEAASDNVRRHVKIFQRDARLAGQVFQKIAEEALRASEEAASEAASKAPEATEAVTEAKAKASAPKGAPKAKSASKR